MKINVQPPRLELCKRLVEVAKAKGVELPPAEKIYDIGINPGVVQEIYEKMEWPHPEIIPAYNCDEVLAILEDLETIPKIEATLANTWGASDRNVPGNQQYYGSIPIEALYNLVIAVLEADHE
jgi:hypothetical protein